MNKCKRGNARMSITKKSPSWCYLLYRYKVKRLGFSMGSMKVNKSPGNNERENETHFSIC